jgi:hypothetical protein
VWMGLISAVTVSNKETITSGDAWM